MAIHDFSSRWVPLSVPSSPPRDPAGDDAAARAVLCRQADHSLRTRAGGETLRNPYPSPMWVARRFRIHDCSSRHPSNSCCWESSSCCLTSCTYEGCFDRPVSSSTHGLLWIRSFRPRGPTSTGWAIMTNQALRGISSSVEMGCRISLQRCCHHRLEEELFGFHLH